jgi:hypothetical protein
MSRILERAAGELTPVVVELDGAVPRLASFVEAVAAGQLILAPIAEAGVPVAAALNGPVKIRSADPLRPFELRASRIELAGPGRARVALADATFSSAAAAVAPGSTAPLVIALAAGTDALDGYTFPVLELDDDACLIETTVPLEPGRTFVPVELYGESRVIRQAAGTVGETIAWLAPDGSRSFRSRLHLEDRTFEPGARCYDLLSEPRRVLRLLELGALTGVSGWYEAIHWGRDRLSLAGCAGGQLTVTLEGGMPERLPLPPRITLGFELFAISYEMEARVLRLRGRELAVSLPLVLRRRRRRRDERVVFASDDRPTVTWRNPLDGTSERAAIVDLSRGGLCIERPAGSRIWPGLTLEGAVLSWKGSKARAGGATVRGLEDERCHLELAGLDSTAEERVRDWLLSRRHPQLERHDGADFRTVLDLYRRAGLLSEYMMRNLEALAPTAAAGWRRLHGPRSDVADTFLHRGGEGLTGAITSIRAWDHTWFTQHFGVIATAGGRTSGALATVNVESILSRRDAHYMAFFVNAANAAVNAFHQRFLDLTGTPETLDKSLVELWWAPGEVPTSTPESGRCRPLRRGEGQLVARGAERALGRHAARALSMVADELTLPATRAGFRRAGLDRHRTVEVATSTDGRPAWAILREHSSAGINLTWMLNASWMVPLHPRADLDGAGVRAALGQVLSGPAPTPTGDRFLIVNAAAAPVAQLEAAGFRRLLRANLFVLTRAGVHRYQHYLLDRYGEVGIKTAVRQDVRLQRERV